MDKELQAVPIPGGAFGIPWLPSPRSSDIGQPRSPAFQGLSLKSGGSPGYKGSSHYELSKLNCLCLQKEAAPSPSAWWAIRFHGALAPAANLQQSSGSQHNLGWKRPLKVTECNHKPNTAECHQTMALLSQEPEPGCQTNSQER